jgi:hypothetical protein
LDHEKSGFLVFGVASARWGPGRSGLFTRHMPFGEPLYCSVALEDPPQTSYLVNVGLDFEAFARLFDKPVNISSAIRRLEEAIIITLEPLLLSRGHLVDA